MWDLGFNFLETYMFDADVNNSFLFKIEAKEQKPITESISYINRGRTSKFQGRPSLNFLETKNNWNFFIWKFLKRS